MNRRDVIILATVVNAVLLLVLFSTAKRPSKHNDFPIASLPVKMMDVATRESQTPTQKATDKGHVEPAVEVKSQSVSPTRGNTPAKATTPARGSVPSTASSESVAPTPVSESKPSVVQPKVATVEKKEAPKGDASASKAVAQQKPASDESSSQQYVSVVVKKGDFLERIAKANHTTVAKLMQINDLSSTQLKIGQVIKVPVAEKVSTNPQVTVSNPDDYYIVKEGDSPWGIALRNGIRLQDLLQLNDLDEQKARKLRPGDRLRIR